MINSVLFFIIAAVIIFFLRKKYIVHYVNRCIDVKIPEIETEKIDIPDKEDDVSMAEHLNYFAGKILADKVSDARLIDFEETENSIIMKYYSTAFFSLFNMEIKTEKNEKVQISISGEKFIKIDVLKEEIDRSGDYLIPYKIIKNEIRHYQSQYEVKVFDMSVFKRFFNKSKKGK